MALELIDKQDNFEIIRDQIAAILVTEIANQQAKATAATKDPDLWTLRVYKERSNPWEMFLDIPQGTEQKTIYPVVNIWFDNASLEGAASNIAERQKTDGNFNIDIYGYGISRDDGAGHIPGDREAAQEAQRGIRLVRNILMAAENTYLQLRGTVWKRWIQSISMFQPAQDENRRQNIVAGRIAFRVDFNEFSPQVAADVLETLTAQVTDLPSGQVVINSEYDYT